MTRRACGTRHPLTAHRAPLTAHRSPLTALWRLLTAAGMLTLPDAAPAQQGPSDSARSTRSGVYTADQAASGRELYALNCMSCHSPASHAGPEFTAKWEGKLFWDLFQYVRESMPKSEPGSLSNREYLLVLAYLLKMNGMPEGSYELPADSTALTRIRIDFKPAPDSSQKR